jgi:maltose O-acetyltransferase
MIKIKLALFIINTFLSGTRFFKLKRYLLNSCKLKIGLNTKVVGPLYFGSKVKIFIGDNCWIGRNINFDGNGTVIIGSRVDIGPHVVISTGGHLIGPSNHRAGNSITNLVKIGDGCWIGTSCLILNEIKIGAGCVLAGGSVVYKDIENNALVAGNPGVIKKYL